MPLQKYQEKRDFSITPEPAPAQPSGDGRLYVIQEHHASRHHWDLRLELDGVLLSWAVPKEPPTKPGVRRLAVHVEDHPVDYASFEGTIPAGQYGAGVVKIWDRGEWAPIKDPRSGMKDGKLEFLLRGDRLQGPYVLIRTEKAGDEWLFMRMKGSFAPAEQPVESGPLPEVEPELCETATAPPEGEDWLHEIKWDGYRVLARVTQGAVEFRTRQGNRLDLPHLASALEPLGRAVLDGELVAFDPKGASSFALVHRAVRSRNRAGLALVLFDLPISPEGDLRERPLRERKERLKDLIARLNHPQIRYSDHVAGSGADLYASACETGLEGVVSKRGDSPYRSGRHSDWRKVRCDRRAELVVGGYKPLAGDERAVGSLLLGQRDASGALVYAGRVGTGFSDAQRHELARRLERRAEPPFESNLTREARKDAVWVEPGALAHVRFLEWSPDGLLRQASLQRVEFPVELPKITNRDRVIDPSSGVTKGEVADYYASLAEWVLPHVAGRPLPILRCPDGIEGSCFFQKHRMQGAHASVRPVDVGEEDPYVEIDDAAGLVALAQMGMIELHPWGSRSASLEHPDRFIVDLDPGEGVPWKTMIEASEQVRGALEGLGLRAFLKVTGGKGLHIVCPLVPDLTWPQMKQFAAEFAKVMAERDPKRYIAVMTKAKRKGKIFIDTLRNGRGATAVAAYSLRARAGVTVSMSVGWGELRSFGPGHFTVRNVAEHLASRSSDPWAGFESSAVSLKQALGL